MLHYSNQVQGQFKQTMKLGGGGKALFVNNMLPPSRLLSKQNVAPCLIVLNEFNNVIVCDHKL